MWGTVEVDLAMTTEQVEQRLCEAENFVDMMSRVHVDEFPIQGTCLSALVPGTLPTPQKLDHILPCKDKDVDKRSFRKQF